MPTKKDATLNKISALFPTDLAKKLYKEFDDNWSQENADKVLYQELTLKLERELRTKIEKSNDSSEKNRLETILEKIRLFGGKNVAESWIPPDDEEIEDYINETRVIAISQWTSAMYFVNLAIGGPVVLKDMLVPEGDVSSFNEDLAQLFATWDEVLDAAYNDPYGENSEQGRQLAKAFATNLRAEIDNTGRLQVTEKLVITKCGSRYILENCPLETDNKTN